ncbi:MULTISPECIES: hypothetical protein [unclassified Duganella]|uniref:hypothetical protein n=1 Tax=unclassified Duganella TaxID=2636909 RepID=UPI0006FC1B5E|nr:MULTISPECIES: hypothetical protein [unclassified Duganella]KQV59111.1 hypothetical protein ASD07_26135 [Duganella sp. Root336D2]KRB97380.1 hypothetical protein ASE26_04985 [Duganella sp. Root198D2]
MKKFAALAGLVSVLATAHAQEEPVVGIWQKLAVSDKGFKLVARTNYIFTNKPLAKETVFSAIRVADPLDVICCLKVKNLKPLKLQDVIAKYSMDEEFVSHMNNVKGAEFVYEAVPVDKAEWNPLMTTIMSGEKNPDDHSPYTAPVISAKLGAADEKLKKLELGPTKAKLKITYPKNDDKAIYQFTINNKKVVLSEETFPHD